MQALETPDGNQKKKAQVQEETSTELSIYDVLATIYANSN